MVNKERVVRLLQQLIRINSENPPGDESRIAKFIENYLTRLGLSTKIYEFKKRRSNLIACLRGKASRRSLLITPHLDTVPAGKSWKLNPFSGKIVGTKIYGLGATDCKGNLACALETINSLIEDNIVLGYDLIFAATADEECGSGLGLIPLLDKRILRPDAAVVLDSDDFDIIITQKGLIHFKVKLLGKRAHGAYPWRGINAIDVAMAVLNDIKRHKFAYRINKYLRPPTINIGTIKGGDKVNVVADWCEFELDFRFTPGMSAEELLKEIRQIIRRQTNTFKIEIEGIQQPYFIKESHNLVSSMKKAMRYCGIDPVVKGSEGATVITFFQRKNISAVATGFGSAGCAHTAGEYVKVSNLYKGAVVLEEFLKNYNFK